LAQVEATNMVANSEFDPLNGTWYALSNGGSVGSTVGGAWNATVASGFADWPVVNGSRIIPYSSATWYTSALVSASAGKVFSASIVAGRSPAPTVSTALDFRIGFWDSNRKLLTTASAGNIIDGTSYKGVQKYVVENKIAPANTKFVSVIIAHSSANATDYITRPSLNTGDKASPYTPTYGTSSSSTVLSLFKDNWSIGINDNIGNITSGIVGNSSSMSLISKNIVLDGNTTVTGDFYAKGGNFKNLNASNLNVGTLNGNQVNITNVKAENITGDITNFIQSNWNGVYGSTTITSSGMTVQNSNSTVLFNSTGMFITQGSITQQMIFGKWSDSNNKSTSATGSYLGISSNPGTNNIFTAITGSGGGSSIVITGNTFDWGANRNIMRNAINMFSKLNLTSSLVFQGGNNGNSSTMYTYIETDSNKGTLNFRTGNGSDPYFWFNRKIIADGSISSSSLLSKKLIYSDYTEDALSEIRKTRLANFSYLNDTVSKQVSPIIDDVNTIKQYYVPNTILSSDMQHIDLYSMITMAWKAIQQLNEKIGEK